MAQRWWEYRHYRVRDGCWGACVYLIEETEGMLEVTQLLPVDDGYCATEDEAKACNEALVRKWLSGSVARVDSGAKPVGGTEAACRRYAEVVCQRAQVSSPALLRALS